MHELIYEIHKVDFTTFMKSVLISDVTVCWFLFFFSTKKYSIRGGSSWSFVA